MLRRSLAVAVTFLAAIGPAAARADVTIVPYRAGGYSYKVVQHGELGGFQSPAFDAAAAGFQDNASAPFSDGAGSGIQGATDWPANTDLLVRKQVTVPAGAEGVTVSIAIDNDDVVYWNGTQIGSGTHENCASDDSFTYPVAPDLIHAGPNLLAVRGTDRGDVTDLDVAVRAAGPEPDAPLTALEDAPFASGLAGQPIDVGCEFADADPDAVAADFAASIDWGDGTSSPGSLPSSSSRRAVLLPGRRQSHIHDGRDVHRDRARL